MVDNWKLWWKYENCNANAFQCQQVDIETANDISSSSTSEDTSNCNSLPTDSTVKIRDSDEKLTAVEGSRRRKSLRRKSVPSTRRKPRRRKTLTIKQPRRVTVVAEITPKIVDTLQWNKNLAK